MTHRIWTRKFSDYTSNSVLRGLSALLRLLPARRRGNVMAALSRTVISRVPKGRRRAERNLALIYPHQTAAERAEFIRRMADNFGRTLAEEMDMHEFLAMTERFEQTGPGWDVLRQAQQAKTGAIIVSAHYANWEAIRGAARGEGMNIGALYRAHNNPHFSADFSRMLATISPHNFAKGKAGTLALVRHLRNGGSISILADQKLSKAPLIPFLGHPASTTLTPAKLALHSNVPLLPGLAIRAEDGFTFEARLGAPIAPTDELTMMTEANAVLSDWMADKPEQWFWYHRRWM